METEVIKFISQFLSVKIESINENTLINYDLGVDGDDGEELLEAFAKNFNVDLNTLSKTYFGPEGISPLILITWPYYFARCILGHRKKSDLSPLSVSHLIKSAEAGKWLDV